MINVKDSPYNAVGNGVADDRGAIQQALDAAAVIGGSVYLPAGTYLVGYPLFMRSYVTLFGDGAASVIRNQVSATNEADRYCIFLGSFAHNDTIGTGPYNTAAYTFEISGTLSPENVQVTTLLTPTSIVGC